MGGLKYGFGELNAPGPGFLPALFGGVLSLLSVVSFFMALITNTGSSNELNFWREKQSWRKLLYSLFSLIGYLVFLDYLGYIVTTLVFCFCLFRFVGKRGWRISAATATIASLLSYLAFAVAMDVSLPKGVVITGIQMVIK